MIRILVCSAALLAAGTLGAAAQSIRVVTYNVGLLKAFGSDYVPAVDARAKRIPQELARFASEEEPQIILLEEVWRDAYASAIEAALRPLGYSFAHPEVHTIIGLSSGLLLAVREPLRITDWRFTAFSKTTLWDSFARKGVLEATIDDPRIQGGPFALVGTHTVALDTDRGRPRDRGQMDAYAAQAAQILAAAQSRSKAGSLPLLLVGDFNTGPGYAPQAYDLLAAAPGIREAGAVLSPSSPIVTWDPNNPLVKFGSYPNEPPAKIDHVFLRNGEHRQWKPVDVRRIFDRPLEDLSLTPPHGGPPVSIPLSDHYGFLADLQLVPTP